MKTPFLAAFLLIFCATSLSAQPPKLPAVFKFAEVQTETMLKEVAIAQQYNSGIDLAIPRTIENGKLKLVAPRDWTSGFFPGFLWYLYDYTGKAEWKEQAGKFTRLVEGEKNNAGTHDMGFKIYCSVGNGWRLTSDPHYRDVLIQSARTLCTRFNPNVGCIRSWDHNSDKWGFPVIIDNMMNLELLFAATKLTGDSSFYHIALSHANTTMKNHFRADYSSFHVIDYDPTTGKVVKKNTHQGYSHESAWARGQAWGIYGFTMCYRETGNAAYLRLAEHIADYMPDHPNMPKDLIPYWDYNAPGIPAEERDASAAAVLASGLYELAGYSKKATHYQQKAGKILESLTRYYLSPVGENKGFMLLHSTGSKPSKTEVNVPLNYADYYYLEALLRSRGK